MLLDVAIALIIWGVLAGLLAIAFALFRSPEFDARNYSVIDPITHQRILVRNGHVVTKHKAGR